MANIQERYGTEAEKPGDKNGIKTLWKYTPSAFDSEKIIELPYAQYSVGTLAAATVSDFQQYKINSTYDPDLTGIGVQPLGRDTWAGIYNYYKVLEAHIKVTITPLTDDSSGAGTGPNLYPTLYGWCADITADPPTSSNSWLMASLATPNSEQQKFSPIVVSDVINGRGNKNITFEYHWDASQFDTSIIDNTKNEWTPVGSDPANINYFSLIGYNPQSTGPRICTFHTEIKYLTAFKQINRGLLNTIN